MNLRLIFDRGVGPEQAQSIKVFLGKNIQNNYVKSVFATVHSTEIEEIRPWVQWRFPNEKVLIFTNKMAPVISTQAAAIKAEAENIPGSFALISLHEGVSTKSVGVIALHELMHLVGLSHCTSNGCLMARKSCDKAIYCISCEQRRVCNENSWLCDECKTKLKNVQN
jgi:hypothetical protein